MEWKDFREKYSNITDEFNNQSFDERKKSSIYGQYDAIAELIRTKDIIRESMNKLNKRINTLVRNLDEALAEKEKNERNKKYSR